MEVLNDKSTTYHHSDRNNDPEDIALQLNNENIHRPEKYRGDAQNFLVYFHLLAHYEWDQAGIDIELPDCHHFKI